MRTRASIIAAFLLAAVGGSSALANDLGKAGDTFPIRETNLLKMLSDKLHGLQASGQLDAMNKDFAKRAQQKVENPPAVAGISDTVKPATWLYDPSIVVPQDYADQNGQVFAHRGDRINPLQRLPNYNKVLVFINGKSSEQVRYGMALYRKYGAERLRLILVNGSPTKLDREIKVPFYFDQEGRIVQKFSITHVPATVVRENDMLRVSEVLP